MKINKNILYPLIAMFLLLFSLGCNEDIVIIEEDRQAPVIQSFEPLEGEVGTLINVTGNFLKNIDTAAIGSGKAKIYRVINDHEAILEVTHASESGTVKVGSPLGLSESPSSFNFKLVEPTVNEFPASGIINLDVSFTGTNLHGVTQVFLDEYEAKIVYQKDDELAIKVPFTLSERVTISLKYNSASGQQSIEGKKYGFNVIKPDYKVTSWPTAALAGSEVNILGENINLTDSVYFGEHLAEIVTASPSFITVRVPDVDERSFETMRVVYFLESEIINDFETELYTRFRKVFTTFETSIDNFIVDELYATTDQIVVNGDTTLAPPEGVQYINFYQPFNPEITSKVVSYFHYDEGDDNLINLNAFDDPVLHFYYSNKGTPAYLQLQVAVGGVKMRLYVERYRTEDEWGLYCIRLKDVLWKDSWTMPANARTTLDYNAYEYLRLNFKPDADEEIQVNLDYVFVSEGAIKGAIDLTEHTLEEDYIVTVIK